MIQWISFSKFTDVLPAFTWETVLIILEIFAAFVKVLIFQTLHLRLVVMEIFYFLKH